MIIWKVLKEWLDRWASDIIFTANHFPALKINWDVVNLEDYGVVDKDSAKDEILGIMSQIQKEAFLSEMELDFSVNLQGYSRFRVNAFSQKDWFAAVFRPISENIKDITELWLPEEVINFTKARNGLVLVTGSVGSGKTTTLASLMNAINKEDSKHMITIEDPIEFIFKNEKSVIEQREVWANTLTFDNGLKYALRQAPDVIMVWEMRDLETFRLALRAAETWNLVFATLHTSGASRTVSRVIDMFPWDEKNQIRQQLSESLRGVIWQILLKTADGNGRVPACEVLVNNSEVANMIRKENVHQINNAIETWANDWMINMKKSLEKLYWTGQISEETYDFALSTLVKD